MVKKVISGAQLVKHMRFLPEVGDGAEQLVAFAARMRVLNVALTRTSEDRKKIRHELRAAGFNVKAFNIAVKRRDERAIGMPWAQLTPIPEQIKEAAERYEAILMHADENRNAS